MSSTMNTDKFSGKAEIYEKYRPSYSQEFIEYLFSKVGFYKDSIIADIGSGTGKLSEQLLEKDTKVICVEPNDDMRRYAEKKLSKYSNFTSIKGTAEQTCLSDKSIDFITVAQAFHWFDADAFKIECQRILKKSGKIILVWNSKVTNNDFVNANSEICHKLCENFKGFSGGKEETPESFSMFFKNGVCDFQVFENKFFLSLDEFIGINLSSSYSLKEDDLKYNQYINELTELFNRYSKKGLVEIPNFTDCYIGEV